MTDKAYAVPLHEQLSRVPRDARLVIDDPDGMGTQFIPVGRYCHEAAEALRARLAQPEPEPYDKSEVNAFVQDLYDKKLREGRHGLYETLFHVVHAAIKHVHAPPVREWQGLTDEELLTVMQSAKDFQGRIAMTWVNHENQTYVTDVGNRIARAIEAKLKEKNA